MRREHSYRSRSADVLARYRKLTMHGACVGWVHAEYIRSTCEYLFPLHAHHSRRRRQIRTSTVPGSELRLLRICPVPLRHRPPHSVSMRPVNLPPLAVLPTSGATSPLVPSSPGTLRVRPLPWNPPGTPLEPWAPPFSGLIRAGMLRPYYY